MRALRTSLFADPHSPLMTTIVFEDDLKLAIGAAAQAHVAMDPEVFVITDIFDVPDDVGDMEALSAYAMERIDPLVEQNMAILFFYTVMLLPAVRQGGFVGSKKVAPFSVERVKVVFEQLACHPKYDGQVVQIEAENGSTVSLSNGHITHVPPADPMACSNCGYVHDHDWTLCEHCGWDSSRP